MKIGGSNPLQCIEFSYLMYDHNRFCDAGRFKVDLVCGDEKIEIFRATNKPSYKWYQAQIDTNKSVNDECQVYNYHFNLFLL